MGFKLRASTKSLTSSVMADTGCQSCLAGIGVIGRLGLTRADLIPVTMKMNAADEKGINILGAAILRFSGIGKPGHSLETRQITYITDCSDRIFLSRDACIQLGMISEAFPTVGEILQNCAIQPQKDPGAYSNGTTAPCGCPTRAPPPPLPLKLPFPATEANRGKLQTYLVEYYKSSTFNTCEHQTLPMMSGPPMRLMIDPNADPVAFHTPIPIPLHWQDEVKASLDQDVRLGVLEPVPAGTPVTWCHRMVICAKKTGKPRCHPRDTPHPVTFPSSSLCSTRKAKVSVRCLERIPQRAIKCRRWAFHYLHHPVGSLQVLLCTTRLHRLRRRIFATL